MREIKFRGWDKEEKRMWWNVQDAYDGLGHHCCKDSEIQNEECRMGGNYFTHGACFADVLNNLDVMQYTGLRDKAGKEIYENDLIKHELGNIFEVAYSGGAFRIYPIKGSNFDPDSHWEEAHDDWDGMFDPGYYQCFEVVGNIHENPELIPKP